MAANYTALRLNRTGQALVDGEGNCHGTCQLGLDPWRRQECGRKECGVMPSGRIECGVTTSRRRISLKGAVAHFFLSFFLFLPHATTCFLSFLIEEPHFLSHTSLSPPLSCPRCAPTARRRPCPVLAARRLLAAALSCPRCAPSARRCPCPACYRKPA